MFPIIVSNTCMQSVASPYINEAPKAAKLYNKDLIIFLITCRAKLLNADWLRQRAFFLNQEGAFGNQGHDYLMLIG